MLHRVLAPLKKLAYMEGQKFILTVASNEQDVHFIWLCANHLFPKQYLNDLLAQSYSTSNRSLPYRSWLLQRSQVAVHCSWTSIAELKFPLLSTWFWHLKMAKFSSDCFWQMQKVRTNTEAYKLEFLMGWNPVQPRKSLYLWYVSTDGGPGVHSHEINFQ